MPVTILVAGGLVKPPPWCGRRFPAVGQGVKTTKFSEKCYFGNSKNTKFSKFFYIFLKVNFS